MKPRELFCTKTNFIFIPILGIAIFWALQLGTLVCYIAMLFVGSCVIIQSERILLRNETNILIYVKNRISK
jgi:hypothetical protein